MASRLHTLHIMVSADREFIKPKIFYGCVFRFILDKVENMTWMKDWKSRITPDIALDHCCSSMDAKFIKVEYPIRALQLVESFAVSRVQTKNSRA